MQTLNLVPPWCFLIRSGQCCYWVSTSPFLTSHLSGIHYTTIQHLHTHTLILDISYLQMHTTVQCVPLKGCKNRNWLTFSPLSTIKGDSNAKSAQKGWYYYIHTYPHRVIQKYFHKLWAWIPQSKTTKNPYKYISTNVRLVLCLHIHSTSLLYIFIYGATKTQMKCCFIRKFFRINQLFQ